jgi:hypothetical protein
MWPSQLGQILLNHIVDRMGSLEEYLGEDSKHLGDGALKVLDDSVIYALEIEYKCLEFMFNMIVTSTEDRSGIK